MLRRNAGDEVDEGGYHWPMGAQPVNGSYTGRGEEGMKCRRQGMPSGKGGRRHLAKQGGRTS